MDWRNRRYFLVKGIHSFDQERQILNLKQKAKVTINTRPEVKYHTSPDVIHNVIHRKEKFFSREIYKDEHIPRGFYNYMVGCFDQDAKIVLDYLETNNFNYKELKPYKNNKMVNCKSWEEFRKNGLLLFINQILHIFGWSICYEFDEKTGDLKEVYPARVRYRGFNETAVSEAYKNLSKFLRDNSDDLYMESRE